MLNLEVNNLEAHKKQDWEFMDSLANCTDLNVFSVEANRLEGNVPSSLGNISIQLQLLFLGENRLTGGFPSGIAYLPNLINVGLDHNQFTGVIPEAWYCQTLAISILIPQQLHWVYSILPFQFVSVDSTLSTVKPVNWPPAIKLWKPSNARRAEHFR